MATVSVTVTEPNNPPVAARKFLADGGIPAVVSGTGSSISSVSMAHIWVEVDGISGCAPCVFDPSMRQHQFVQGVDVAAAMGMDIPGLLAQADSGLSPEEWNGQVVNQYVPFDREGVANALNGYATNLHNSINKNLPQKDIASLVGERVITEYNGPALRQSAHPNQAEVKATWTGDIPHSLRSSIRVQFTIKNNNVDLTYYGDQIHAHPLVIRMVTDRNFDNWLVVRRGVREVVQSIFLGQPPNKEERPLSRPPVQLQQMSETQAAMRRAGLRRHPFQQAHRRF